MSDAARGTETASRGDRWARAASGSPRAAAPPSRGPTAGREIARRASPSRGWRCPCARTSPSDTTVRDRCAFAGTADPRARDACSSRPSSACAACARNRRTARRGLGALAGIIACEFAPGAPSPYDLAMRGALVILLLAAPVYADEPRREGQYSGVTPGEVQSHDTSGKPAKPKRPPTKGTLTWIGFAAKDGGAEVFFQSVAPFEVSQRVEGGALIVHLGLTRLGHNTWRQIDTRFFDNPLSGIVARAVGAVRATRDRRARGAGIEARIAFKSAKDVKERSEERRVGREGR